MPKTSLPKPARSHSKTSLNGSKKPILIKWLDASDDGGDTWEDVEEIAERKGKRCIVFSIGWKVGEDSNYIYLAADKQDKNYSRRIKIPKVNIL